MTTSANACTCALCGQSFHAKTSYGICPSCYSRDRLREYDRLESTKSHLEPMGVPVELTLLEWLRILSDFKSRCAYCLHFTFKSIEMVDASRGLVKDNVVPICASCLVHKRHGFEKAEARVRAYLGSEPHMMSLIEFFEHEAMQEVLLP